MSQLGEKVTAVLLVVTICTINVQLTEATIVVISKNTNQTVFSAEESGIDAASAYDLRGSLVIANPVNACHDLKPPPARNRTRIVGNLSNQQLQRREAWILWATYNYTGDECSLSRKARHAEAAGYSAIIVTVYGTNDSYGVLPGFMGFDWMGIRIYTSVLGENMGNALRKFAYPNAYYIEFENEPYFQLGLLVNFIFLGCLGVIIVVVLLRLFHCLYMKVSSSVQERRRKRKAFLTESQLKKLPVLHWRTSIPQDTCSICIENFEVGEEIRVLPCSHVFHKPCIDPWLIHSSRRCPNCKGKVIFPNENFSDSSNSDSDSHMEDSEDEYGGSERTPLLRGHASDSDDQIEDTRFINTFAESHQSTPRPSNEGQSSACRSNSLQLDESKRKEACLIDISSETEEVSDDSFGSFQSATGNQLKDVFATEADDSSCNQSIDSDKTFVGGDSIKSPLKGLSKKNEITSPSAFGSNTSFFSCLESELEKSTASSSNHEFFQSFST